MGLIAWAKGLFLGLVSFIQAFVALLVHRPALTLSMGGYISVPSGLASRLLGIPLLVHEQNAQFGLANLVLSKISNTTLLGLPLATPKHNYPLVGNPLRPSMRKSWFLPYAPKRKRLRLLVLGGSQGAEIFNQVVPEALGSLPFSMRPQVRLQTGKGKLASTCEHITACGVAIEAFEYASNMDKLYAWCDLALCRAGAMTVSETLAYARPAIFVPYPGGGGHQQKNIHFLIAKKLCFLIAHENLNAKTLGKHLRLLHHRRDILTYISAHLKTYHTKDVTKRIIDICLATMARLGKCL